MINRDDKACAGKLHWLHRSKLAYRLAQTSRQEKLELLLTEISIDSRVRILDIGAGAEWECSENTLERYYPHPERIVAVSLDEGVRDLKHAYPAVTWMQANGLALPFTDKTFDVAFSNAVIEHIIGDSARRQFIGEMLRVAKRRFVTTPNALFPIEPHSRLPIVHWLPDSWHNWIIRRIGIGFISKGPGGYYDPITPGKLRGYFADSRRVRIRLGWLGMTLIAVCADEWQSNVG